MPTNIQSAEEIKAELCRRKGKLKGKDDLKIGQEKEKYIESNASFKKESARVSVKSGDKVNSRVGVLMDDKEGFEQHKTDHPYNKVKVNSKVLEKPGDSCSKVKSRVFEKQVDSNNSKNSRVRGWMEESLPVVKYSYEPCVDFYDSMLEMVMGRGFTDLKEMEDMFACYVVLNSPHHHHHIEEAFTNLLTDLYKSKVLTSIGFDGLHKTHHKESPLV